MPRRLAQHLFVAALALALLSSCAVGPKLKELYAAPPGPEPGQARIYFYRPLDAFLIARETEVVINDQRIGQTISGTVFYRDALPGRYRIHTVDDEISVVYLSLEAGDVAYVRAQSQLGSRSRIVIRSRFRSGTTDTPAGLFTTSVDASRWRTSTSR